MPVYEYTCPECEHASEELRALGQTDAPECSQCGAQMQRRFSRVAVKYSSFGFNSTDSLVTDTKGRSQKDFKALRNKAEEISDS